MLWLGVKLSSVFCLSPMPALLARVLDANPAQWLGPCSLLPDCPNAWYRLSLRLLRAAALGRSFLLLVRSDADRMSLACRISPGPAIGFDLPVAGSCIRTLYMSWVCLLFLQGLFPWSFPRSLRWDPCPTSTCQPPCTRLGLNPFQELRLETPIQRAIQCIQIKCLKDYKELSVVNVLA